MDKPLILIADDDKAIRVVLEKKLNRSGFNTNLPTAICFLVIDGTRYFGDPRV